MVKRTLFFEVVRSLRSSGLGVLVFGRAGPNSAAMAARALGFSLDESLATPAA